MDPISSNHAYLYTTFDLNHKWPLIGPECGLIFTFHHEKETPRCACVSHCNIVFPAAWETILANLKWFSVRKRRFKWVLRRFYVKSEQKSKVDENSLGWRIYETEWLIKTGNKNGCWARWSLSRWVDGWTSCVIFVSCFHESVSYPSLMILRHLGSATVIILFFLLHCLPSTRIFMLSAWLKQVNVFGLLFFTLWK